MASDKEQLVKEEIDFYKRHIASQLLYLRRQHGLTQKGMGKLVGVSYQQVQKYENAKSHVRAAILFHIANMLEVPLGQFLPPQNFIRRSNHQSNHPPQPDYQIREDGEDYEPPPALTAEIMEVIALFSRIDDKSDRASLVSLMRSLAGKAKADKTGLPRAAKTKLHSANGG